MKRAALYVRVSTQEQKKHGLSVDSQIVALQEYCDKNDILVVGIYNDAGISARKKYNKRPALLQLLQDCEDRKIDLILFTRLDRWFRSVAGYHEVQSRLNACHVPWRSIWEDYNTETSDGVFKVNIMLSIAQAEADRTSEKIKSVNEYRRDKGYYVGSAPTGYVIKDKHLVKDEKTKDAVQAFFDAYLNTYSTAAAMHTFNDMTGRNISAKQAKDMLINYSYTGNAYGSICEPYITVEQHEEIKRIRLSRMRAPKNPDTVYLFSRLCKCSLCGGGCSSKTRRYFNTNKEGKVVVGESKHYRCCKHINKYTCVGTQISESRLERYLLENLDTIISEYNVNVVKQKGQSHDSDINKLKSKLERIGIRYEDGDITLAEYREKRNSIQAEIAVLQRMDQDIKTQKEVSIPDNWKDMYTELTDQNKQLFWRKTINKIILHRGRENPEIFFN